MYTWQFLSTLEKQSTKPEEPSVHSDTSETLDPSLDTKADSPFIPETDDSPQSDSSAITPPPDILLTARTKSKKRPAMSDSISLTGSDSDDDVLPQKRKKPKTAKKVTAKPEDLWERRACYFI
jgi:hypothetical protein